MARPNPKPPKPGRPPLIAGEVKSTFAAMAVSERERAELRRRARAEGVSVSEYMRRRTLAP